MNEGRDGDGQQPADGTQVSPASGETRSSRQDGPSRPGAPVGPPPPAESFRPVGPPPPAESFRPARPVAPARTGGQPPPGGPGLPAAPGDQAAVPPTTMTTPVRRRADGLSKDVPAAAAPSWTAAGDRAAAAASAGPVEAADGTRILGSGQTSAYDWPAGPGEAAGRGAHLDAGQGAGYGQSGSGAASGHGNAGPPDGNGFAAAPPGTTPAPPPRRRRRRRALIAVLVALVVLFVAGDRVAVVIAKDQMRKQVKASIAQSVKPGDPLPTVRSVSIGGFPFLTQVLFGKYTDIGVEIEGIPTPGPKISLVKAHLKGVHVSLGDAIANKVGEVPVDDVRATVGITYADLNAYLLRQPGKVQVTPVDGGRKVEVTGTVDVPVVGTQEVSGVTSFQVSDNALVLVPSEVKLKGTLNLGFSIPGGLLPSIPIPVSGLPFHLRIVDASTNATGISLTATAKDLVLPSS